MGQKLAFYGNFHESCSVAMDSMAKFDKIIDEKANYCILYRVVSGCFTKMSIT